MSKKTVPWLFIKVYVMLVMSDSVIGSVTFCLVSFFMFAVHWHTDFYNTTDLKNLHSKYVESQELEHEKVWAKFELIL